MTCVLPGEDIGCVNVVQESENSVQQKRQREWTAEVEAAGGLRAGKQPPRDYLSFIVGFVCFVTFLPYIAFQVAGCRLWDFIDRRVIGLVERIQLLSKKLEPWSSQCTKSEKDGFMLTIFLWVGIVLPAIWFFELYQTAVRGEICWRNVLLYNALRIGPMYVNFAWVYTLAHKEAHQRHTGMNLFKIPFLKGVFNFWIGIFHGVLPGPFTHSHCYNHHRYDNDHNDIICTVHYPRDDFGYFVCYVARFFAYASNLSSLVAFAGEGRWRYVVEIIIGTSWYLGFLYGASQTGKWLGPAPIVSGVSSSPGTATQYYVIATLGYAFVEANVLLAAINMVWHAFVDARDPANEYVNSTTILEPLNFLLEEEFHVVHHAYAGAHWSRHPELYEKHRDGYEAFAKGMPTKTSGKDGIEFETGKGTFPLSRPQSLPPSVFVGVNIFDVFTLMMAKDYAGLAKIYHKPYQGNLTDEQLAELLKARLKSHGSELAAVVGKRHRSFDAVDTAKKDG